MSRHRNLTVKLRAAWWTIRAVRTVRAQLAAGGLDAIALDPPSIPYEGKAGVRLGLRLTTRNCLVSAAVRQAWCAAHGREYDIVIGVTAPSSFKAHAWLSGDPASQGAGYSELARRPWRRAEAAPGR